MKEESNLIIENGILFRIYKKSSARRVVSFPAARMILAAIVEKHNIVLDENNQPRIFFKH